MDWKNIDLNSPSERNRSIINSLSFDILLLEISCNLQEINKRTIMEQFEEDLQSRIITAREVMNNNLDNILKNAIEYRNLD